MQAQQVQRLSGAAHASIAFLRPMSGDANVLRLPARLPLSQVQAIAAQLMTLPEVEYAEPDQILLPVLTPNDQSYGNQWDLSGPWGINAPAAWDITTDSTSIVVADIDTGITNHAEFSGRTVPGYDFITDPVMANDGGGRDSDPSDPGDWVTAAESTGYFAGWGCSPSNSSWHGTHTAGTIGASANNSVGVAGINWISRILPVRVLGKCGGTTSDVVDGMRWAAGLSVSDVPSNPNPAKVMNLSLGGSGSCATTFQNAINDITAAGAVVVVAAGNNGHDLSSDPFQPADCNGVITVAATDPNGSKASYINYGSTVEISAPGNSIYSTFNTGTTIPASDSYAYDSGTSMATPHVTGVVSLMLSVNPSLPPAQVLQILQSTARTYPDGTCTNCGGGILDAGAAVAAAGSTISGNVVVDGATLRYTDGVAKTATSAADGSYSFTVSKNWTGDVTPAKTCYTFSPDHLHYAGVSTKQTAQNYTAAFDPASACADVTVAVHGINQGPYIVAPAGSARQSYPALNSGPVSVSSANSTNIIASERVAYFDGSDMAQLRGADGLAVGFVDDVLSPALLQQRRPEYANPIRRTVERAGKKRR